VTGTWPPEVARLPVCPKRDLPIPYIAEVAPDGTGHFTVLDAARASQCLERRLCAMCGDPMGAEVTFIGDQASLPPESFWIEPPVHERCAELAVGGLCPYLSRQRVPRRVPDGDMSVIGMTAGELAEVGRAVPKRPVILAVAGSYTAALAPSQQGEPVMVYRTADIIRVRRFTYDASGRLAESRPRETVRVQRRVPRRRSGTRR
jgi:hypothetical protein